MSITIGNNINGHCEYTVTWNSYKISLEMEKTIYDPLAKPHSLGK